MKRIMVFPIIALISFAISLAVTLSFNLSKKVNEPTIHAESDLLHRISQTEPAYQTYVLKIINAPNEPVKIEDVRFSDNQTGDLLIEVKNISPKSIIFVGGVLAPIDTCPTSDHPLAYWVGYGDWRVLSGKNSNKIDSPIAPDDKAVLRLSRKAYDAILKSQQLAKCPSNAKPEFVLDTVAFSDGSGWKGFADGVDHSEWNGRAWSPSEKK